MEIKKAGIGALGVTLLGAAVAALEGRGRIPGAAARAHARAAKWAARAQRFGALPAPPATPAKPVVAYEAPEVPRGEVVSDFREFLEEIDEAAGGAEGEEADTPAHVIVAQALARGDEEAAREVARAHGADPVGAGDLPPVILEVVDLAALRRLPWDTLRAHAYLGTPERVIPRVRITVERALFPTVLEDRALLAELVHRAGPEAGLL